MGLHEHPKYIRGKNVVCFDVDETLILWSRLGEPDVHMICPYSGAAESGHVHKEHIERLKKHKEDNHTIIIWSGGGMEWAEAAIDALGIADYVDIVIDKPMQYYDDLDCTKWMGRTSYLDGIQYGHRESPDVYKVNTMYIGDWDERED